MVGRLAKAGIEAESVVVDLDTKKWFRVLVPGFKGKTEAETFIQQRANSEHLQGVWFTRYTS